MTKFASLFELTPEGLGIFRRIFLGELVETALDLSDPVLAKPVPGTGPFEVAAFATAREMSVAICNAFGPLDPQALVDRSGIWAWLTFVLIDVLFPKTGGVRKVGDIHRWFPGPPNDYQKAQRHLVRMSVQLYSAFGNDADHLLCGKPGIGPEIREQLTSQQDMFSGNFQKACRALYFDQTAGTLKRGVGSRIGPAVPRRLAAVRKQLDVTWDMTDLTAKNILELLPKEFDRFKHA
jgi:hypothetical protein